MMKKKRIFDRSVYRSLVLISQFGINMLVPIWIMLWLGLWLDDKFGTSWLTILFFFIGAIAGGQNSYRMAKKIMDSKEKEEQRSADIDNP